MVKNHFLTKTSLLIPSRYRLNSASDDEDDYPIYDDFDEHMQYMAARERLQEFPGRIPARKKKETTSAKPQRKQRVSIIKICTIFSTSPRPLPLRNNEMTRTLHLNTKQKNSTFRNMNIYMHIYKWVPER